MKPTLLFILALLAVGCQGSGIYSDAKKDFTDNRWAKDDVLKFETGITETGEPADVYVTFGFIDQPQFKDIPVMLTITSPDGKATAVEAVLHLVDENGTTLGECAGDVCDLTTLVQPGITLQKGKYTFALKNNFKGSYLPNVLSVGVQLKKQE